MLHVAQRDNADIDILNLASNDPYKRLNRMGGIYASFGSTRYKP